MARGSSLFIGVLLGLGLLLMPMAARADSKTVNKCIELFERAQVEQKKGHLSLARADYEICAHDDCPAAVRADCSTGVAAIDRAMPTITFIVRDAAGNDEPNVKVVVDGTAIENSARASAIEPGDHLAKYTVDGKPCGYIFTAHEGEKSRVIILTSAMSSTKIEPAAPEESRSSGDGMSLVHAVGPFVTGTIGLALMTISIAMVVSYNSEKDHLLDQFDSASSCKRQDAGCSPSQLEDIGRRREAYDNHEQEGKANVPIMVGLGVGGLVVVGGSIVWLVLRPTGASKRTGAIWHPTASITPNGVSGGLSVTF